MLISELVTILQEAIATQGDIDVKGTWEGTLVNIKQDNLYTSSDGTLLIDLDDNFYKEDFQKDWPTK